MSKKPSSTMPRSSTTRQERPMPAMTDRQRQATFVCNLMPSAQEAYLAGDFNGWNPAATPMMKCNGHFEARIELEPGEHEYQFVVDGQWMADPEAPMRRPNPFGGENSVVRV